MHFLEEENLKFLFLRQMGNYRFRLSSMISTSWFLKLRHLVNIRARKSQTSLQHQRYHSTEKKKTGLQHTPSSSLSSQSTAAAAAALPPLMQPNRASYYIPSHRRNPSATARPPAAKLVEPRTNSRLNSALSAAHEKADAEDLEAAAASQFKLPPILTKPAPTEEERGEAPTGRRIRVRRMSSSSPRVGQRQRQRQRPGMAESLVVMKASADPSRDFAESMVEMIVANGIRGRRELEELLACYLSLNAKEYHEVIVKAFQRVSSLLASDVGVLSNTL